MMCSAPVYLRFTGKIPHSIIFRSHTKRKDIARVRVVLSLTSPALSLYIGVLSLSRVGCLPLEVMPRRSSGGRPAARGAPRAAPVRNPPQPVSHAPPPAPVQGGSGGSMLGGLGSTIAQGMAFGTGSAVAHRAVDAVLGPRTIQHETVVSESAAAPAAAVNSMGADACSVHSKAFQDCVNSYGADISKCQFYMDMLTQCKRNSGSVMSA